jgi:hypothetical protein
MRTWITLAVCTLTIATAPLDAFAYWVDNWVDEPVYGYVPESYTYQVDVPDYGWVDQGAPTVATQTQDTVVGTVSPPRRPARSLESGQQPVQERSDERRCLTRRNHESNRGRSRQGACFRCVTRTRKTGRRDPERPKQAVRPRNGPTRA